MFWFKTMAFSHISTLGLVCFSVFVAGQQSSELLKKPEIYSLHIYSDVKYRFATTRVTSRIKNVDTTSREAIFHVTLPNEAFITNLTLEIDGKLIVGEIKEKEVAKKQYEAAKQRGESAGYIGTSQRETNKFNLAVTVAPKSKVSFNLTYQELLKRKHGHYEQVIYIDPGQPVPDMDITVVILESREITDLRVPPLRNDVNADIEDLRSLTAISRPSPKTAEVKFVPSIEHQRAQSDNGMAGQFVVQYDVERSMDSGDVLLVNGYFVHFFAPEGFKPIPNDVLFILDTSGSMMGTKLSQLKTAMLSIIGQLGEGDRFNMMTFSGSTSFWKSSMVDIMDEDTREEAKSFINKLEATGWTNIELALTNGIDFLGSSVTSGEVRSPVIVFLTDGEATQGVTDRDLIQENVRKMNEGKIPIFSLAFGSSADYDLVKKISIQNNGIGRKIYEASDAAMQIAGFYNEISVTLLSNVTFQYLDAPVKNVTQHTYSNYFNGSEFVICGRVDALNNQTEDNSLTLKIMSNSIEGPRIILTGLSDSLIDISENITDSGDFEAITEKVWAYLTIKQLLDKELVASSDGEKTAFRQQVLELSLKYGFVTPLTSMVVTLPDEDGPSEPDLVGVSMGETSVVSAHRTAQSFQPVPSLSRKAFPSNSYRYPQSAYIKYYSQGSANPFPSNSFPKLQSVPYQISGAASVPDMMSSYDLGSADLFVDSDDDLTTISKIAGRMPDKAKNIKKNEKKIKPDKKNSNRKNRKQQKKKTGSSYPLRIQFPGIPDPVCFNLYDQKLKTAPGMYTFHVDPVTGLRVELKLMQRLQGKWTEQGVVKELHLVDSQGRRKILTKDSFVGISTGSNDSSSWKVKVIPNTNDKQLVVQLPVFNITVNSTDDGFLLLMVNRSSQRISGSGIMDQVSSKDLKLVKVLKQPDRKNKHGKNKAGKQLALFKLGGAKFPAVLRVPSETEDKCWSLKQQNEASLVNMSSAAA